MTNPSGWKDENENEKMLNSWGYSTYLDWVLVIRLLIIIFNMYGWLSMVIDDVMFMYVPRVGKREKLWTIIEKKSIAHKDSYEKSVHSYIYIFFLLIYYF